MEGIDRPPIRTAFDSDKLADSGGRSVSDGSGESGGVVRARGKKGERSPYSFVPPAQVCVLLNLHSSLSPCLLLIGVMALNDNDDNDNNDNNDNE